MRRRHRHGAVNVVPQRRRERPVAAHRQLRPVVPERSGAARELGKAAFAFAESSMTGGALVGVDLRAPSTVPLPGVGPHHRRRARRYPIRQSARAWPFAIAIMSRLCGARKGRRRRRIRPTESSRERLRELNIEHAPVGLDLPGLDRIVVIDRIRSALLSQLRNGRLHIAGLVDHARFQQRRLAVPAPRQREFRQRFDSTGSCSRALCQLTPPSVETSTRLTLPLPVHANPLIS